MKKYILLMCTMLLTTGCFYDPLSGVKRLARSKSLEKKQKASREYKKAINTLVQAYASYAGVNKDVGRQLMLENYHKPALDHLKAAVEIKSNDADLYYWIGVCYANLSGIEKNESYKLEAKYNYEIAINLTPNNKSYLYSYAQLLIFGTEEYTKAEKVLLDYMKIVRKQKQKMTDLDALLLLGRTYYMLGFTSDSSKLKKEYYGKAYATFQDVYEKKKNLTKDQVQKLEEFIWQTEEALR